MLEDYNNEWIRIFRHNIKGDKTFPIVITNTNKDIKFDGLILLEGTSPKEVTFQDSKNKDDKYTYLVSSIDKYSHDEKRNILTLWRKDQPKEIIVHDIKRI